METVNNKYRMTRLEHSIKLLKLAEPKNGYYLAFSGGKDSVVLYDVAVKSGVKFDAHYSVTGIDPKEVIPFIRKNYPDVIFEKPVKSMYQLIVEKQILPTRVKRICCAYLKEAHGKGRVVLTGIRWAESKARIDRQFVDYNLASRNKVIVNPILNWSDSQVWKYIKLNKLPYLSLYDKGAKRVGCLACPMAGGKQQRIEMQANPHIKKMYIRAINKCKELHPNSHFHKFKDAEDVIGWWTSDKSLEQYRYEQANQIVLY